MLMSAASLENETIERIANQLIRFKSNNYHEKVYLHTDSEVYTAGEVIWMNARLLQADNHMPSEKSNVVHVKLYDQNSRVLSHKKILAQEGSGSGDILLSDTLSAGNYLLRAYTMWMRNAEEDFFFEKEIYVLNEPASRQAIPLSKMSTVNYFPEGGQFVQSQNNRVAIKVTGTDGYGVSAHTVVLNDKLDTLQRFKTNHMGMGSFDITPKSKRTYHLVVMNGEDTITRDLPAAVEGGINMVTNQEDPFNLRVALQSSKKFIGENNILYVLLHARGEVRFAAAAGVAASYELFIPREKLAEGVNHLTVFDVEGKPLLERLYFRRPEANTALSLQGLSEQYKRNQTIKLDVISGTTEDMFVTFSVHNRTLEEEVNIQNYLLLSSDLQGYVEKPSYYFLPGDSIRKAADLLMMTHGWTRFTWSQVMNEEVGKPTYPAENGGQVVRGKLINRSTGMTMKDTLMLLSLYSERPNFIFLRSDQEGVFTSTLPKLYGTDVLSVSPAVPGNPKGYELELINLHQDAYKYIARDKWPKELLQGSSFNPIEKRVLDNYKLNDPRAYGAPSPKEEKDRFMHYQQMQEPKFELYPAKYVQLSDVSEMVFELLPSVKLKKKKGRDMFYVMNETMTTSFSNNTSYEHEVYALNDEPAAIFINGVRVFDHSVALGLDYQSIHKVEIYNKKSFDGVDQTFHGVVAFTTNEFINGEFSFYSPAYNETKFEGYSLQREYYVPTLSEDQLAQRRKPDFRHLLYWSPNTTIKAADVFSLDFNTSLVEGDFYVRVEGITASGKPVFELKKFSVTR